MLTEISLKDLNVNKNTQDIINYLYQIYNEVKDEVIIYFDLENMDPLFFQCVYEMEKRMFWEDAGVIANHEYAHYKEVIKQSELSFELFGKRYVHIPEKAGYIKLREKGGSAYPGFAIYHDGKYPDEVSNMDISDGEKSKINEFMFQARLAIDSAPKGKEIVGNDDENIKETIEEAHKLGCLLDVNFEVYINNIINQKPVELLKNIVEYK